MSAGHTPGPWKTRKGFQNGTIEIFKPNKAIKKPFYPTEIAVVEAENEEGRANARLIAAAPTLQAERDELLRARLVLGAQNIALQHQQSDMLAALIVARGALATALKSAAPDWFATEQDLAEHLAIKQIDAAIAKATPATPIQPAQP